jgi:hypothetical protein
MLLALLSDFENWHKIAVKLANCKYRVQANIGVQLTLLRSATQLTPTVLQLISSEKETIP